MERNNRLLLILLLAIFLVVVLISIANFTEFFGFLSKSVGLSPGSGTGTSFESIEDCRAPIYLSDTFPPSEFTPPLPPLNPREYNKSGDGYICRNFAYDFCEATKRIPGISWCNILVFDRHVINIIDVVDSNGKRLICIVEPQSNEYFCMPAEEFYNLDFEKWAKETLCKKYYKFTDEMCNFPAGHLSRCADIIGVSCSESGQESICFNSPDSISAVKCKCKGAISIFRTCKWELRGGANSG